MPDLLVVEDVERVSRFLTRGLEAEGHKVAVAATGPEGYARAVSQDFDLLILDVMLPGFSGKDLCRKLRADGKLTPVLMLTALDSVVDKVECLRGGADDYLVKPFDFDELTARVDALIRRARGQAAEVNSRIEIAGIVIDRDAKTISRHGELVDFTAREFQLLELFASSPGKVLSRSRILNKIWGYDADPMTNVVDVYIKRIRAKLNWQSDGGPIQTVRGYGYRFADPGETAH